MKLTLLATLSAALLYVSASALAQQAAPQPVSGPPQTPPSLAPSPLAPSPLAHPPVESTPPTQSPAAALASGSQTAGAVVAPPPNSDRYIVGPEDSISVNVWKEPTLSGAFPVRPDGMISLALIGDVPASGRTPMDLATDLTERLKKFVQDPTVTVTVLAVNSKRVYMLGEVAHIGAIPLTSALSPLQAISAAGGLTPYANKKRIYILRGAQGQQKKIPFNYSKAIKDGNQQGVILQPGDTIVVP